jgi:hypothetical protein
MRPARPITPDGVTERADRLHELLLGGLRLARSRRLLIRGQSVGDFPGRLLERVPSLRTGVMTMPLELSELTPRRLLPSWQHTEALERSPLGPGTNSWATRRAGWITATTPSLCHASSRAKVSHSK